jgi:ryanodine receptor 2
VSYTPAPINTETVVLPQDILALLEQLAENNHDIWAQQRFRTGWTYGPARNDERKEHPCLVPYQELPESEKVYDRQMASETLKAIIALGYRIKKCG